MPALGPFPCDPGPLRGAAGGILSAVAQPVKEIIWEASGQRSSNHLGTCNAHLPERLRCQARPRVAQRLMALLQ